VIFHATQSVYREDWRRLRVLSRAISRLATARDVYSWWRVRTLYIQHYLPVSGAAL
jgi:hypothetical protein